MGNADTDVALGVGSVKTLFFALAWCLLFVVCWPIAILLIILWPLVWLISLPSRLVSITFDASLTACRLA